MPANKKELFLELVGISGEISYELLDKIIESRSYKRKVVAEFKNKNLIYSFKKDKLNSYRLTENGRRILLNKNKERFGFCFEGNTEISNLKSEYPRRIRLHLISENLLTMHRAGIEIFRDKKPLVFNEGYVVDEDLQANVLETPIFYNCREVRAQGDAANKITGSRMTGVLLTEDMPYIVYNTGKYVMEWKNKSEERMRILLYMQICQKTFPEVYQDKQVGGIISGAKMEMAYTLLTSGGKSGKNFFVLAGTYDDFLYVPNDDYGELILKILGDSTVKHSLDNTLAKGLNAPKGVFNIDCDGTDSKGRPVLFAYTMNLPRIARFNRGIQMHRLEGVVICFDFQEAVLSEYLPQSVSFETIKKVKFERSFFPSEQ